MRNSLIAVCGAMVAACGPTTVPEERSSSRCLSLTEAEGGGLTVLMPSRISWSFSVDTCSGEPVSGLQAEQLEVFEDGKKVSAFESQQRLASRAERFRLYSVVLIDLSGSMLRSGEFPRLDAAVRRYVETALQVPGQAIALMTFDGRAAPQLVVPFTSSQATLLSGLDSLSHTECATSMDCASTTDRRTCAGWRCVDDSTNLNGAVVEALKTLDGARASADVPWHDGALVVFTDGSDQAGRVSSNEMLTAARSSTSHVFAVGLGGEVDAASLTALGRDGMWPVEKSEKLEAAFVEVATRVSGLANRFYVLEYCSPRRSGRHTLELNVSVDHPTQGRLTGTLTGHFDATGFESGCSL